MTSDQEKDFELEKKILGKSDGPVGEFIRVGATARRLVIAEPLAGAGMDEDNLLDLFWEGISQKQCEGSIYDDRAACRRMPVCDCLAIAGALKFAITPILARLVAERDAAREALLNWYAHMMCEFPNNEVCGKLDEDACVGCRARAALTSERSERERDGRRS